MNINRQLLKSEDITIVVKGSGKNLQEATSEIFKKVRAEVYKDVNVPIIQMETLEVYFEKIKEEEKKSVLSRKKDVLLEVDAKIILNVKYLDIHKEDN